MNIIEKIRKIELARLEKDLADLKDYCDNPDIAEFIEIMCYDDYTENDAEASRLSHCLTMLCFHISGLEFSFNEYSCSMAESLSSFIGNYFYDDSYFVLEHNGKEWDARSDDIYGKQDVRALINSAKDNREYWNSIDERMRKRKELLTQK